MDRNTITVMSGQIVDSFDNDFRELYAVSDPVDLYGEFNVPRPPIAAPVRKLERVHTMPVSTSRFQATAGDPRQGDVKVPAHKYHNPKYSLVFGNNTGHRGSVQDLSSTAAATGGSLVGGGTHARNGLPQNHAPQNHKVDHAPPKSPGAPAEDEDADGKGDSKKNHQLFGAKKQINSFRHFLKSRGPTETLVEGVVTPQSPAPVYKAAETNGVAATEEEDSFNVVETPKPKTKKPSNLLQRSMSLQVINTGDDDGTSGRNYDNNPFLLAINLQIIYLSH